jgi:hypothetical protein
VQEVPGSNPGGPTSLFNQTGERSGLRVRPQTNNHYSQQTLDGVGHVVKQVTGTVSGSTY